MAKSRKAKQQAKNKAAPRASCSPAAAPPASSLGVGSPQVIFGNPVLGGGPMPAERHTAQLGRLLSGQEFESVEEINAFLAEIGPTGFQAAAPRNALDEAQDLMYDAWDAPSRKQAVALARKALTISPDCADAYVLLAQETARTKQQARDLYEQGVAAGERALGPGFFEENAGCFWGLTETRPYMRARAALAETLWEQDDKEAAIEHARELLRLNPGDNQGIRYNLLAWLLREGRDDEVGKLLDQYQDDGAAQWLYARALVTFRLEGPSRKAVRQVRAALDANPFVPEFLLGERRLPKQLPDYVGFGDENEAVMAVALVGQQWIRTPGAVDWLADQWLASSRTPRGAIAAPRGAADDLSARVGAWMRAMSQGS
jgi:tetratricopeptide (TPR) repeat protein